VNRIEVGRRRPSREEDVGNIDMGMSDDNDDVEDKQYYFSSDHLGSSTMISNGSGELVQNIQYMPFGETFVDMRKENWATPYRFNGKEQDCESGMHYYGARYYDSRLSRFISVDPMADQRSWVSPYNYVQNNPINRIDPTGMLDNPVYGSDGTYRGDTKEGFTGDVIIYDGDKDFTKMSKDELLATKGAGTYDSQRGSLSNDAKSKIWTNIASHFEGTEIDGKEFTLDNLEGKKIHFEEGLSAGWKTKFRRDSEDEWGHIRGEDLYKYESTVENLASSIIVHEWYSHAIQKKGSYAKNHSGAFDNVINKNPFWKNTTSGYKSFNLRGLGYYKKLEGKKTGSK